MHAGFVPHFPQGSLTEALALASSSITMESTSTISPATLQGQYASIMVFTFGAGVYSANEPVSIHEFDAPIFTQGSIFFYSYLQLYSSCDKPHVDLYGD